MTGFIPEIPPLDRLPLQYEPWETLADQLPDLITNHQLRLKVNDLPVLLIEEAHLPTERHWQRAYCVLTFLSQGYLWERGERGAVTILPKQLAIPWWEVSTRCGLPPVATYTSTVLWNWSLKDPTLPVTIDNVTCPLSFTGTRSEEWFYLVPLVIEVAAISGINATVKCLAAVEKEDETTLVQSLREVSQCIKDMCLVINKMYDECDPNVFYNRIRPFQAGSKNLLAFSSGLIYEGVSAESKSFLGASAGQSSTLPVFDILLGVQHQGTEKEFLDQQRWHMPRPHRQFLLSLSLQSSLREYILQHQSNCDLVTAYNVCVKELLHFRNEHIILVTRYIVTPSKKSTDEMKEAGSLATRGTGGSDFMVFLKTVRDNTKKCLTD